VELLQRNGYKLRAPEPEDLVCMMQFENTTTLWELSNTTGPYSRFYLKQYIETNQNNLYEDKQLRLMIENPGKQVVGIIDLCNFAPFHHRAEVGIVIATSYQGQGIGELALSLLKEHSFDFLGIHQLYAYIDVTNEPCRKLFKKCGFEECAYLKDWMRTGKTYRDVVMVQCINS
jgi:diamine N-acetyltransferase